MIEAAIFDLDGLLIDSEPLWWTAEMEVFGSVGLTLDEEECRRTIGMAIEQVVELRYSQSPWSGRSREEVAAAIHRRVISLIRELGRPMPGAAEAVALARSKGAKTGLATSSDREIIDTAMDVLGLQDAFDVVQSASGLPYGKPHPLVYLIAAERLGADPARCVAIEDSISGLIAAKAARMTAIAVPEKGRESDSRLAVADLVLGSLVDLDGETWERISRIVSPFHRHARRS